MQVLSALHSSPIQKLKRAWALVNKRSVEVFEKLTELMSNLSHYKTYYDTYTALDPATPALPLMCTPSIDFIPIRCVVSFFASFPVSLLCSDLASK